MSATWVKFSNWLLSCFAGVSAFILTLLGFLLLGTIDQQIVASLFIGLFALAIVRLAAERPNSGQARAVAALVDRLLAVHRGDLRSPAPAVVRSEMPALAAAVDGLFEQVRSNLDNFQTMAMYDPVTSLPNRIHFRREAERMLKARRLHERTALLFIDLDGFKEVNDRLGHAQGDQVLTMVANRLRVVAKAESEGAGVAQPLLARLAGDEFTMLLPNVSGPEEAQRIACRAVAALAEPYQLGGQASDMSASIGIALAPDHGDELTPLMKAADVAMYHAKASGRARVCLYDAELARASVERAVLEAELRRAVEQDELELVYRPQLCIRTGAIVAGEALVRWTRPCGGKFYLDEVVGLAEGACLAHRVAEWSVAAAAAASGRLRAAGLGQRISLKVPAPLLERGDFAGRLQGIMAAEGAPLSLLEIEVDAAALDGCSAVTVAALESLRKAEASIALAGFGAAGSNLCAMSAFPLDRIKLHPNLVHGITRSAGARTIVSAAVHLIHGLGCQAVAEGVEREEELRLLRSVGCDLVQGFFGVEPMAEEAFIAWVAAQDCARSLARAS